MSVNNAKNKAMVISHEPGYTINQEIIIESKGLCWVDKAHRFLFCETCQALEKDPSKKIAAIGEKNTGGKFS